MVLGRRFIEPALAIVVAACSGGMRTGTPGGGIDEIGPVPGLTGAIAEPAALGPIGARRLTRQEVRLAVVDLLGLDPADDLELLPVDDETPFDNDYTTQFPSAALVSGLSAFAASVGQRLVADPNARARVVGCSPSAPNDEGCLRTFVERFGRRALRRPLTVAEIDEYTALQSFAVAQDDFYAAVRLVLHAMLQDMEFIYRLELGEPVAGNPNLFKLNDYEIASRLSFFLWGSVPDDVLLDQAAAGELRQSAGVQNAAARMLGDPKADQQIQRLHAMWLDYDNMPVATELQDPMARETGALLRRVIFQEKRPWLDVFTLNETFVDTTLATHYNLPSPGANPGWVAYPDARRGGLLSHGSFLSTGSKFGDTSPTLRGKNVLTRLLCRQLAEPPADVNIDEPPEFGGPDSCKTEIYAMGTTSPCSTCHAAIDSVGWGLENYGPSGEWREHETDRTDCVIDGQGSVEGLGSFAGAAELGQALADSGELEACFVEQIFRFAVGRGDVRAETPSVESLADAFGGRADVIDLLLGFVSSDGFRHRVVEE